MNKSIKFFSCVLLAVLFSAPLSGCYPGWYKNFGDKEYNDKSRCRDDISEFHQNLLDSLPSLGINCDDVITPAEGSYLNYIFDTEDSQFDFRGKKICFLRDYKFSGKQEFFNLEKDMHKECIATKSLYAQHGVKSNAYLYILSPEQKADLQGYDACVVYGTMFVLSKEQMMYCAKTRLKKHHKK